MAILTKQERIIILTIKGWGDRQRSDNEVRILFNETFGNDDEGILKSTVFRTMHRFEETGVNKNRLKSKRLASATSEEHQLEIAEIFVEKTPFVK